MASVLPRSSSNSNNSAAPPLTIADIRAPWAPASLLFNLEVSFIVINRLVPKGGGVNAGLSFWVVVREHSFEKKKKQHQRASERERRLRSLFRDGFDPKHLFFF